MRKLEYRYTVAIIYAIVLFLDRLDLTIVNIALPAIADHFHILVTDTEWVNTAFLLAISLSIPISNWMGDRYGTKRIFIYATAVFGITSLLCALSPNIDCLIVMRFLQGLASGLIVPVGMSMVFRAFNPREYASISSYIFIPSLIAPALAPMVGGIMIYYFNWRWVFLFATPICAIAVLYAQWLLKESPTKHNYPLDFLGFILSGSALLLLFHVLSVIGTQGITSTILLELSFALGLSYLFVKQERHTAAPLLHLNLFRKKLFIQANLIQMFFQIGHFGAIFLIAIYLQMSVGHSAMLAGMTMGMQAFGAMCSSRLSVQLCNRYSAKLPICIGLTGIGLITPCILFLNPNSSVGLGMAMLFVRGLFSGLCGAPMQAISIMGFSDAEMGQATAAFNIFRQLSISLGIALSALLLSIAIHDYDLSILVNRDQSVFYAPFLLISGAVFLGVYVTLKLDKAAVTVT